MSRYVIRVNGSRPGACVLQSLFRENSQSRFKRFLGGVPGSNEGDTWGCYSPLSRPACQVSMRLTNELEFLLSNEEEVQATHLPHNHSYRGSKSHYKTTSHQFFLPLGGFSQIEVQGRITRPPHSSQYLTFFLPQGGFLMVASQHTLSMKEAAVFFFSFFSVFFL